MFHVEQLLAFLGVASVCLGATPPASTPLPCPAPLPAFSLALASDSEEVAQETSLAFEYLLYGDARNTSRHLTGAHALDPSSPLPIAGLALLSKDTAERAECLQQLRNTIDNIQATPVEAFYLSAFLKLLDGKTSEAASEFSDRSDRYTRDHFSAAWAILLLHYSSRALDTDGHFHTELQNTLKRAESFYLSAGKDFPPACYLRALVEESLPEISDNALAAAENFSDHMPDYPAAHLLYAHLLYKTGQAAQAVGHFHQAFTQARDSGDEMLALHARLYESVALWSDKKDNEALAIRRELNAQSYSANASDERNIFLAWESHTLPLRILVLRETLPSTSELRAALHTAAPKDNIQPIVADAAHCIADTLSARIAFHSGKPAQAITTLNRAETIFKKWQQQNHDDNVSPALLTPLMRLRSACAIAIYKAKTEIYPSTAETWADNLNSSIRQSHSDCNLPPVVPSRF